MLKVDNIQKLPEEMLRHIFVSVSPSIQNQLKNSCKVWHEIGSKTSPTMYKLVDNGSFQPHQDDWHYMMMHAAWDNNVEVMVKILNRTPQRNFDYHFGECNRSFLLGCISSVKKLYSQCQWKEQAPEKIKELDIASPYRYDIDRTALFRFVFEGNSRGIEHVIKLFKGSTAFYNSFFPSKDIDDALYMAVYNDNHYCIEALSSLRKTREPNIKTPLDILVLAIRKKKKKAFEALVKYDVYGCLNYVSLNYAYGGINTTILDELCKMADIPYIAKYTELYKQHIAEYVELYKKLGGKNLIEMGYSKDYKDNDLRATSRAMRGSVRTDCVVQ